MINQDSSPATVVAAVVAAEAATTAAVKDTSPATALNPEPNAPAAVVDMVDPADPATATTAANPDTCPGTARTLPPAVREVIRSRSRLPGPRQCSTAISMAIFPYVTQTATSPKTEHLFAFSSLFHIHNKLPDKILLNECKTIHLGYGEG